MAEIYNPFGGGFAAPATDNDISFVASEYSEDSAEHEHELADEESAGRPNGQLLAEALSVIDSQSRTIQKLMALLTGDGPAAGDMG